MVNNFGTETRVEESLKNKFLASTGLEIIDMISESIIPTEKWQELCLGLRQLILSDIEKGIITDKEIGNMLLDEGMRKQYISSYLRDKHKISIVIGSEIISTREKILKYVN